jgi:putative membrane protein
MKNATMLAGVLAVIGLAGLSVAAAPSAPGQAPQQAQRATPTLSKQDTKFFEDAAQGDMLEVKLGELAVKNAASEDVRKFGQRMVDDHSKLNAQLAQIAQDKKGVVMPQQLDKKHQNEIEKLSKNTGAKFDHEYMSRMVDEHEKDIKAFEKQAKDGKDPDLKQFASTALPTLQSHLAQAKEIEARVKK